MPRARARRGMRGAGGWRKEEPPPLTPSSVLPHTTVLRRPPPHTPPPHPQCVSPSSSRSSGNVVYPCRPHCVLTTSILRVGFAAIPHPGGCGQGRSEAVNPGTLGLSEVVCSQQHLPVRPEGRCARTPRRVL